MRHGLSGAAFVFAKMKISQINGGKDIAGKNNTAPEGTRDDHQRKKSSYRQDHHGGSGKGTCTAGRCAGSRKNYIGINF